MSEAMALTVKATTIWIALLALAIANGALREAVLIPWLGRTPGLVLSGIVLLAIVLVVTVIALPWLGAHRLSQRIGIGVGWFVLTLAFELSFARFQGKSWASIREAYSFKDGNIWPIVLLVIALAPYLAGRFRGWASGR